MTVMNCRPDSIRSRPIGWHSLPGLLLGMSSWWRSHFSCLLSAPLGFLDKFGLTFDIFQDLEAYLDWQRHQVELKLIARVAILAWLHYYLHDAILLDLSHFSNPLLDETCLLSCQLCLLIVSELRRLFRVCLGRWLPHVDSLQTISVLILVFKLIDILNLVVFYIIIMIRHWCTTFSLMAICLAAMTCGVG